MNLDGEHKLPRSPKRVAIEVGVVILLLGLVVGTTVIMSVMDRTGDRAFDRGFYLGLGLAPPMLIGAAIGYLVQSRRLARGK